MLPVEYAIAMIVHKTNICIFCEGWDEDQWKLFHKCHDMIVAKKEREGKHILAYSSTCSFSVRGLDI